MKIIDGTFEKIDYQDNRFVLLYTNNQDRNFATHWHTAIEIIMPLVNTYTVIMGKTTYQLVEGDILIIPPGELHELIAPSEGVRRILLFDFTLINSLKGFSNIITIFDQPKLINKKNSSDIYDQLKELFDQLAIEYTSDRALKEAAIYSMLIQMFVLIGRSYLNSDNRFPDVKVDKQKEYIQKFNTVFEYINNNYMEDISLESVANLAGFSKFHFSRLFKQFTDASFYDYLNQRRVKEAEKLLRNPNLSITEIALRSGFSSISTFNRVFKSYKECTPTEFKNLYQRGAQRNNRH